jgi:predicted nucleic acid-binding protein
MSRYLVDANVLLRVVLIKPAQHAMAKDAINNLEAQGREFCITPQNVIELWAVATRPIDKSGFG